MTEREQFEAWAKVRYAKNPHFWLRQIDDGGYSCGMADSAWEAWQAARAQPAQAVPMLTDDAIRQIADACDDGQEDAEYTLAFARRVEQAVRAKMEVAVPMTREQAKDIAQQETWGPDALAMEALLIRVIRHAERHHGLVGKEGA